MSKKNIFYGGVQGVGKTDLLTSTINSIGNSNYIFDIIPIASYFENKIKSNRDNDSTDPVIWYEEDWKKHDEEVTNDLCEEFKIKNKINIINCHFATPYKGKDSSLLYRKFESADIKAANVNIIYPETRYDIHLIDIDDATGISQDEQKMYIHDLLIYALSVQNISAIKGGKIQAADIIREYYKYTEK
jgi:hypothetical protein